MKGKLDFGHAFQESLDSSHLSQCLSLTLVSCIGSLRHEIHFTIRNLSPISCLNAISSCTLALLTVATLPEIKLSPAFHKHVQTFSRSTTFNQDIDASWLFHSPMYAIYLTSFMN